MVKTEDLKRINILKDLPPDLLDILSKEAYLSIFSTDTVLFKKDEKIDFFYMLLMGQVALEIPLTDEIKIIIDMIQSGSSFGISALVSGERATSTAVCQEPSEVVWLPGERMIQLFGENGRLGYHLMHPIARHYKDLMDNRTSMIMKTVDENPEFRHQLRNLKHLGAI